MSELEQLRNEVNELRERVAKLEARPTYHYHHHGNGIQPIPLPSTPMLYPPYVITCGGTPT